MRSSLVRTAFFSCLGLGTADVWVLNTLVLPEVWALSDADKGQLLHDQLVSTLRPVQSSPSALAAADSEALRTSPFSSEEASAPDETNEPPPDLTLEFETSSRRLDERAKRMLVERVDLIRTAGKIVISGHADATGPEDLNEVLSRERALSVARGLRRAGVPRSRILVEWWGSRRPRAGGDSKRVEIYLGDTP